MHSPNVNNRVKRDEKHCNALSWCRQSTFWHFLSLRCNLLSQRPFVSIVRLQVISFFDVIELHFHLLRFTTPLCINCQGGLSSGHHCDCTALFFHNICCLNCVEEIDFSSGFSCYCTALCFHNISCFELVIIRYFLQFLHRVARCSHNIVSF